MHDPIFMLFTCFTRDGKYSEVSAKAVIVQILNLVAFCHLQGVVHRDIKPQVGNYVRILAVDFSVVLFI